MSRSDAYEKAAFDWAATTDVNNITWEHILKAYRLNLKSCSSKPNPCKRNCVNNPKCLSGLGERRLFNFKNEASSSSTDEEKRNLGSFAGLKNLGATCYVNSLLQVWYHNPFLREAIYKWKPEDDDKEVSAQLSRVVSFSENTANSFNPVSPVGQLQFIFARLQFSCRSYVDPSQFVNSLQLDVSQQQDAQEFSKLFLTLMEDDLSSQKNQIVKNIVQTQYCGEYDYVTRCSNCSMESKSPSKFYELSLNIRGHKDIHQSLEEFFSPEILEGSNQYYCNNCESKQNVIRTIRLKKCPPYLNLQLLRFIYDRQKGCRRKLNTSINFPMTLNMSKYFSEDCKENTVYTLCAVLVHRGSSAHSGHYIAHIKDRKTGSWFKFNDEKVEQTEENVLKLCTEELNEDGADNRSDMKQIAKFTKGSSDPYMLVYKNASLDDQSLPPDDSEEWDIPYYLHAIVVAENSLFEDELEIAKRERIQNLANNKEKQKEMLFMYKNLVPSDNEQREWMSKSWIKDWISSDFKKPIPPVDNSFALCPHNKLSLKYINAMKCVNSEGASLIYQKYGCKVRLVDCLCRRCVENKVQSVHIKFKLADDSKKISSLLKFSLPLNETSFWVGKESLRCWKQFALKRTESANEIIENGDSDSENQPPSQNDSNQSICNSEKLDFNFNEEVVCEHGKLGSDESYRRLVSMAVWSILKSHFPNAPEFDSNALPCEECRSKSITQETLKNQYRKLANDQKQQLYDLYSQRNRISVSELQVGVVYYLIDYQFYLNWKNFIRDPANYESPAIIDNASLKCIHHRLIYPLNKIDPITRDPKFLILFDFEWTKLLEFYNFESCITLRAQINETTQEKIIKCDPPYCEPCYTLLLQNELKQLLNYQSAKIYVRKIQNKYDDQPDTGVDAEDDKFDETFNEAHHKRHKSDTISTEVNSQSNSCVNDIRTVRRSSRRRKCRDEREFIVSSLQTLLSLKIEIMNDFKVPPYDQNLFLNDVPLKGNDRTLAELNIIPNSLIYLKVDEPAMRGASMIEEDYLKDSAPETGFKGTQLQKS